jgi:hypothetical protein
MSRVPLRIAFAASSLLLHAGSCAFAQPTPGQSMPAGVAKALPFVSPIFGDNMVLQRFDPWAEGNS